MEDVNSTFENLDRRRYYGLRIGDIVISSHKHWPRTAEVMNYSGFDNNRVQLLLANGKLFDEVAEWCTIVIKVEDRK
jgi:hypothetical protein